MRQPSLRAPALAVALVFGVLALPAIARADDDSAAAREHYQKGTSYYDLGRYADAIKEFEAAYEIKNDPALLYNLAQSNRLAGNSEQALHFYRTYLRYVPKATNRAEIEDRIKQLDQLLAQKNAAQVTPPNQTIPPGGTAAPPSSPPAVTTPAEAPPNAMPPAGLPESAAPASPPMIFAPGPAPVNDHHQMILAGKITAAVGGALFIIGAAYGAAAVGAANDVNNEAKNGQAFDPSVEKRGKDSQKAEATLLTLGALTGVAGGILFFYGRHLATQEAQASVTPMASSSGGGVSLRVTF